MHSTLDFSDFAYNLSAAGGFGSSPAASEEYSSELEYTSEQSSEESSEYIEESFEMSSGTVYVDYSEQIASIQSGINDLNTRLDLSITLCFIALALFVSVIFFRIFNWFWKDL